MTGALSDVTLATISGYHRQSSKYTQADEYGANNFHHDLLAAVVRRNIFRGIHLFDSFNDQPGTENATNELLREAVEPVKIQNQSAWALPHLASAERYLFLVGGPQLISLGRGRESLRANFPICSVLHSTTWEMSPHSFLDAALVARPYDRLITPSHAGRSVALNAMETAAVQLGKRGFRFEGTAPTSRLILEHIPLGVEIADYGSIDQKTCRRVLGIQENAEVILYVGRLSASFKADLEPLLLVFSEIVRQHPSAVLLLAGSDSSEEAARLKKLGGLLSCEGNVKTITNFPHFLKPTIFGCADIFVSPVDNIQETFGIAIVEAMAAGLPVVASDWSGYRELVSHGETGFLVPTLWAENAGALASGFGELMPVLTKAKFLARSTIVDTERLFAYIDLLLTNKFLRHQMGEAGRKAAALKYSWDVVIGQMCSVWEEQVSRCNFESTSEEAWSEAEFSYAHFATRSVDGGRFIKVNWDRAGRCYNCCRQIRPTRK